MQKADPESALASGRGAFFFFFFTLSYCGTHIHTANPNFISNCLDEIIILEEGLLSGINIYIDMTVP